MRFEVPQFIDTEDKIFGRLSFKEFAYIAGGCGLSYMFYRFIPSTFVSLLFIVPILGFAGALAFYRPNNKPFIEMVQSAILFFINHKLYIWKKENTPLGTKEIDISSKSGINFELPNISNSKLKEINFNIDTTGGVVPPKKANDSLNLKI